MKKFHTVPILGMFLMLTLVTSAQAYTWQDYNGHSYALTDWGTWTQAESEAVSVGAHLVTIDDAAENTWLATTFADTYARDHQGESSFAAAWIGLYNDQGSWKWIGTGQPAGYMANSPWSGGTHAYIHLPPHPYASIEGLSWNDNPPHDSLDNPGLNFKGIMEKDPSSVPEPVTTVLLGFGLIGLAAARRSEK